MCKLTKLEPQLNRIAIEMANSTGSKSRNFVAASVPHLDWHCIPKAGSTIGRTHGAASGLQIDGRTIAEVLGLSDDARRKIPTVHHPSENVSKPGRQESRASLHSFDSIDAAKPSADQPVAVTPLQRCFASGVGTVFMTLASE